MMFVVISNLPQNYKTYTKQPTEIQRIFVSLYKRQYETPPQSNDSDQIDQLTC